MIMDWFFLEGLRQQWRTKSLIVFEFESGSKTWQDHSSLMPYRIVTRSRIEEQPYKSHKRRLLKIPYFGLPEIQKASLTPH